MKRSWKTLLFGVVGCLGQGLEQTGDPKLTTAGNILTGLSLFLMGNYAKDKDVTGVSK